MLYFAANHPQKKESGRRRGSGRREGEKFGSEIIYEDNQRKKKEEGFIRLPSFLPRTQLYLFVQVVLTHLGNAAFRHALEQNLVVSDVVVVVPLDAFEVRRLGVIPRIGIHAP